MDQTTEAVVNEQPTQPDETTTTSVLSSDQTPQPQEQTVDFKTLIPKEYQDEKSLQNFLCHPLYLKSC